MKIKKIFCLLLLFSLSLCIWAQTEPESETEIQTRRMDLVLQFTPGFYINPEAKNLKGGPSAPVYQTSVGLNWPNDSFISVQPTLTFFYMVNEWIDGSVYPIEWENRTALTQIFLLDIPAVFSIHPGSNKLEFSLGLDFMARFSTLATGVNPNDKTNSESVTAEENVKLCNQYYWRNAHFLYTKVGICWERELIGSFKGGPVVNVFFPIGSLISKEGLLGTIVNLGIKISI